MCTTPLDRDNRVPDATKPLSNQENPSMAIDHRWSCNNTVADEQAQPRRGDSSPFLRRFVFKKRLVSDIHYEERRAGKFCRYKPPLLPGVESGAIIACSGWSVDRFP